MKCQYYHFISFWCWIGKQNIANWNHYQIFTFFMNTLLLKWRILYRWLENNWQLLKLFEKNLNTWSRPEKIHLILVWFQSKNKKDEKSVSNKNGQRFDIKLRIHKFEKFYVQILEAFRHHLLIILIKEAWNDKLNENEMKWKQIWHYKRLKVDKSIWPVDEAEDEEMVDNRSQIKALLCRLYCHL